MQLSNIQFIYLFLPVVVLIYYIPFIRKRMAVANTWLVLASLVFYAWSGFGYTFLLLLSMLVNYLLGLLGEKHVKKKPGKWIVGIACLYNLGALALFKFAGQVASGIADMVGVTSPSFLVGLALPLGISFYTFKAISYIIDVYRGKVEAQKNPITLALYFSFFGSVISGPITKYHEIEEQLKARVCTAELLADGAMRFVIGLSKTMILSTSLYKVSSTAFSLEGDQLSVAFAWVGALAYMLYIYYDFSGYSDMAIGIGKMVGFTFKENFNYPYLSRSVSEYWRRWHISLGEWFQEYLYYPLSLGPAIRIRKWFGKRLNRRQAGMISGAFTLVIVWLATGIWHGANWTFVVWGLLNFLFVFIDSIKKPAKYTALTSTVGLIGTFLITLFTKVIFNAESLGDALQYFASMFHLNGNAWADALGMGWTRSYLVYLIVGMLFAFPVVEAVKKRVAVPGRKLAVVWDVVQIIVLFALFMIALSFVAGGTHNPPLYANF